MASESLASLSILKGFKSAHFRESVSARAFSRGVQFAMEGYVSSVVLEKHDAGFSLKCSCNASFEKRTKRQVTAELGREPSYRLLRSTCECTAGMDNCSHVAGLLHYVASVVLYLEHQESTGMDQDLPPTSKKQAWGLPPAKRRIEPSQTLEETNFKRVKEGQTFTSSVEFVRLDARPSSLRGDASERVADLLGKLELANPNMVLLRYRGGLQVGTSSTSNPRQLLCSPFAAKPIRLPPRFLPLWMEQSQTDRSTAATHAQRWKAKFLQLLGSVNIPEVERETREQASADTWFLERVCRVTASNVKKVMTRRRDFQALVDTLLYKEPPTHLPALHWGRVKEPEAVAMYVSRFPARAVSLSGFVINEDFKFLGASPDRFVRDPDELEPDGLIEVKCPVATMEVPEVAAVTKSGFCLQRGPGGIIRLDRSHAYYLQVMCQLGCTKRSWCDFVVMSGGGLFVERIRYDKACWEACLQKLKHFYMNYMLPELACPGLH